MSRLERLAPSASTLARTVGTGLPTFPLGLTEEMVMAPPEPELPHPSWYWIPFGWWPCLRFARLPFLALARAKLLISAGLDRLIVIPQRVVHKTLVGKDRSPLTSSYSPKCVEGEFSEVRQEFIANSLRAAQMLSSSKGHVKIGGKGRIDNDGAQRYRSH